MNVEEADSHRRARCVVWRRRGTIVPERLTEALARSGCAAVHAESEFEAVVQLCRGPKGPVNVLLVVEPSTQPAIGELLEVADRYVPDAVLWAYEGSPSPQIRAVGGVERSAWRGQPRRWPAPGRAVAKEPKPSKPSLRLAGGPPEAPATATAEVKPASNNKPFSGEEGLETRPERPPHLLTDEELAMLLAIDPGKAHN